MSIILYLKNNNKLFILSTHECSFFPIFLTSNGNPFPPEESHFNPLNKDYFERSDHDVAATFGNRVENRWFEYRMRMDFDSENPFAPWKSIEEFQLVEWLVSSKLSQGAINLFLQLPIVGSPCLRI